MEELKVLGPAAAFICVIIIIFGKYIMPTLINGRKNTQSLNCPLSGKGDLDKFMTTANLLLQEINESSRRQEKILLILSTKLNGSTHDIIDKYDK